MNRGQLLALVLLVCGVASSIASNAYGYQSMKSMQPVENDRAFNVQVHKPKVIQTVKHAPLEIIKKLPGWPAYGRFPSSDDKVHGDLSLSWASWFYTSDSSIQDATSARMGDEGVKLKDILILSRLMVDDQLTLAGGSSQEGWVNAAGGAVGGVAQGSFSTHYLYKLANYVMPFDGWSRKITLNLNYARMVFDQSYALSLNLPVVFGVNKAEMTRELTRSEALDDLASSAGGTVFFERYPDGLSDFYREILDEKEFDRDPRNFALGVGDLSVVLNKRLESDHFDFGIVGVGVTAPTAREADRRYVWPVEMGNGGFWEAQAHLGFYTRYWRLFNPHVFVDGRFRLLMGVDRRVSQVALHNTNDELSRAFPLVDDAYVLTQNIAKNESNIPALAQQVNRIAFRKGPQVTVRVGSVADDIFLTGASLDIFYELMVKGEDRAGFNYADDSYDALSVMKNTAQNSHKLGFVYAYQYDDKIRLEAGFGHHFAGQSVLRDFEASAAMQFNF